MEALTPADRVRHQLVTQQLLLSMKEMKEFSDAAHFSVSHLLLSRKTGRYGCTCEEKKGLRSLSKRSSAFSERLREGEQLDEYAFCLICEAALL
jgi:hypothetical protein